jgi:hypothetical protein
MLVTYLTIDPVNLDLALRLAAPWGAALVPRDPPPLHLGRLHLPERPGPSRLRAARYPP